MNEITANEKYINDSIFSNYFRCQSSSLLPKDLIRAAQAQNLELVNYINNGLITLKNTLNNKRNFWRWEF